MVRVWMALLAAGGLVGCSEAKPDCKGTATVCGDGCVELRSDNLNCGACGSACDAGQVCSNGACTVTCATGLVNCGGHCIDPATDRAHCGATGDCADASAGATCTDGQLCSAAQCVQTCSDSQTACPAASPTYCADLTRDANNCGACGATCPTGQRCVTASGTAACACPSSTPDACGAGAASFCTNMDNDPQNCGTCGTACDPGQVCAGGICTQTCSTTETTACPAANPTYCTNTAIDANNCGGCGAVCPGGQQCSGGSCACPTATPDACTTGGGLAFCANTETDSLNCGSCNHPCGVGEVCVSGVCALTCAGGATKCAGACVDTNVDPANCGSCGNVCPAGEVCSSGTCGNVCPVGEYACGGHCIDPNTDPSYCGAAADCTGGAVCGANQACYAGVCRDLALPCTWTLDRWDPLDTLPAGAIVKQSPIGTASVTAAYGRTAFYTTSDWTHLLIPTALVNEPAFAVEVDVYVPAITTYQRHAGVIMFTDAASNPAQVAHGIWMDFGRVPGGSAHLRRGVYLPSTVSCYGWDLVTGACNQLSYEKTTATVEGDWHTIRFEGARSRCVVNAFKDGELVDTYSGECDMTGGWFSLATTYGAGNPLNTAFSNFKVFRGTEACVP